MHASSGGWKRTIIHEFAESWVNFVDLAFFLVTFLWLRRLILAQYDVYYTNYWFPLIQRRSWPR